MVNLSKPKLVNDIKINFLSDQGAWIFFPNSVECYVSKDGKNFNNIGEHNFEVKKLDSTKIKTISFDFPSQPVQYVKIIAKKMGPLPQWHIGSEQGGKSWIFVDEIQINYE